MSLKPWIRLALTCLCSCAEPISELPAVTPKLVAVSDANPYQNGWRDAGFRLDPADKDTTKYAYGWPSVDWVQRIGNRLYFQTSGFAGDSSGSGASWYRHTPGSSQFEWMRLPDGGRVRSWDVIDSASYLLSSKWNLYRYDHGNERWDSLAVPFSLNGFLNPRIGLFPIHGDTISFVVTRDTIKRFGKDGKYSDTGIYFDTLKLKQCYLYNVKTGKSLEVVSKDTSILTLGVYSYLDGMYTGDIYVPGFGAKSNYYWNPSDSLWRPLPGTPAFWQDVGSMTYYRGAWYGGGVYAAWRYRTSGNWEYLKYPGREVYGDSVANWGFMWRFQVINDTLYGIGSSLRIYDPVTQVFKEVAGGFTSGELPPKSIYSKVNRGCFNMGNGWSLAKFGDTIYYGTIRGLWKIGLSKTVVCDPRSYGDKNDTCGIVALQEECIAPGEYCCKYQVSDTGSYCKDYQCPAAARTSTNSSNPMQPK